MPYHKGVAQEAVRAKPHSRRCNADNTCPNGREKATTICPGWDMAALKLYYDDDANLSNLSEKTIAEIRSGNHGILRSIRKLYFLSERNDPQTPRYMTESKARRGKVANGPVEQTELYVRA